MFHEIPFDSKSETRLFVIFSLRALATTAVGALLGITFGVFINMFLKKAGLTWIITAIFSFLGFIAGTIKIPEIPSIPVTKQVSDQYIYEVFFNYLKFKKRRKLYVIYKED